MLGSPQDNSSQPLEIYDSKDEQPPQLGGENEEEELEENVQEETKEETEHSDKEEGEEAEPPSKSPLQNPLQEDKLAQIFANMGEYIQLHSSLNLDIEARQSQEHSIHSKSASEEMNDEEEVEAETTQEIVDQTRVTSPEKPNQEDDNTEEVFQIEDMDISQGGGIIPKEQSPGLRKEIFVPSKKKTNEIKRL